MIIVSNAGRRVPRTHHKRLTMREFQVQLNGPLLESPYHKPLTIAARNCFSVEAAVSGAKRFEYLSREEHVVRKMICLQPTKCRLPLAS